MPMVYASIIDVIGKKLYTGDIAWIREYIQNAIDARAHNIVIKVNGRDVQITDDGDGMGPDEINTQLFSIGGSTKPPDRIGQFGIGMYAGSGICSKILVRTRREKQPVVEADLDMEIYRKEIGLDPETGRATSSLLFDEVVPKIFHFRVIKDNQKEESHFTQVKFTDVQLGTIEMITKDNGKRLKEVLENYVPIEISNNFQFKKQIDEFLKDENRVSISLWIDNSKIEVSKFSDIKQQLLKDLITREIKNKNNNTVAKLWAAYSASGKTLGKKASLLVKYKGLTVGDESVLTSKFGSKDTRRFIGEIIVKDLRLQLNTERTWFLDSKELDEFVILVGKELNKLYDIANFDSKLANGLKKKVDKLKDLKSDYSTELRVGNSFNAQVLEREIRELETAIQSKTNGLIETKKKIEEEVRSSSDPYASVKLVLADSVESHLKQMEKVEEINVTTKDSNKKWDSSKYIRTLLEKYVVNERLREVVAHKNSKDTLSNIFTLIEESLKEKGQLSKNFHPPNTDMLIDSFYKLNEPPSYIGEDLREAYYRDFKNYILSIFSLFRNPAAHTFIEHFDNDRNNLQFLLLGDLTLSLIDSWIPKDLSKV